MNATMSHICPLLHKQAPRTHPEEDVEVPKHCTEDETLPEISQEVKQLMQQNWKIKNQQEFKSRGHN